MWFSPKLTFGQEQGVPWLRKHKILMTKRVSPNTVPWIFGSNTIVSMVHVDDQVLIGVVGRVEVGDHTTGDAQQTHNWNKDRQNNIFRLPKRITESNTLCLRMLVLFPTGRLLFGLADHVCWVTSLNWLLARQFILICPNTKWRNDIFPQFLPHHLNTSRQRTPSTGRIWPDGSQC